MSKNIFIVNEIKVSAENCYCNDVQFPWEFNPYKVHLFLVHECGFHSALVWASNLQDALDELCNNNFLDIYQIDTIDLKDYEVGKDSEGNPEYEGIANLGNASEPFDIENLSVIEIEDVRKLDIELLCRFAEARGSNSDTIDN